MPVFDLVVVCDGARVTEGYSGDKSKLGKVTADQLDRYTQYKAALRAALPGAARFEELSEWKGFSGALRHALGLCRTEFILVAQHDWELMSALDVPSLIRDMQDLDLTYVTMSSSKLTTLPVRHRGNEFGIYHKPGTVPDEFFTLHGQHSGYTLTYLPHWHDKPHLVRVQDYLKIFRSHRIARFPEDSFGHVLAPLAKAQGVCGPTDDRTGLAVRTYVAEEVIVSHTDARRALPEDSPLWEIKRRPKTGPEAITEYNDQGT